MPPRAHDEDESNAMDDLKALVEEMSERLGRFTKPQDSVYDPEGYVIGHSIYIEVAQEGDLIATATVPGLIPMVYRRTASHWRNEYGMPTDDAPRPWRLLWRNPIKQAEEAKPKKGSRKAQEGSDGED